MIGLKVSNIHRIHCDHKVCLIITRACTHNPNTVYYWTSYYYNTGHQAKILITNSILLHQVIMLFVQISAKTDCIQLLKFDYTIFYMHVINVGNTFE